MNRLLLSILLSSVFFFAEAQYCTPDTSIKSPGFHPKSLDVAYVDSMYKQVLQIRVFPDTVIDYGGMPVTATIDSINLDTILGMPAGLEYFCSRKNCSYTPDSTGCATLEGTVTGPMGDYPLSIVITVYGKVFGISVSQPDTLDQFTVIVDDLSSVNHLTKRTDLIYPNPSVTGSFVLDKWLANNLETITCLNGQGQLVPAQIIEGRLNVIEPVPGIYLLNMQLKDGTVFNRKVIISQ